MNLLLYLLSYIWFLISHFSFKCRLIFTVDVFYFCHSPDPESLFNWNAYAEKEKETPNRTRNRVEIVKLSTNKRNNCQLCSFCLELDLYDPSVRYSTAGALPFLKKIRLQTAIDLGLDLRNDCKEGLGMLSFARSDQETEPLTTCRSISDWFYIHFR